MLRLPAANFAAARRYAYQLVHGPLLPGRDLCATCGVPGCINPWHVRECRLGLRTGQMAYCVHGHEISDDEAVYWQDTGRGTRIRVCRECACAARVRYRTRLRPVRAAA